jgi:hypothetical protein
MIPELLQHSHLCQYVGLYFIYTELVNLSYARKTEFQPLYVGRARRRIAQRAITVGSKYEFSIFCYGKREPLL